MPNAFRTKDDATAWVMQLRDARLDPDTDTIWARDPINRALGRVSFIPCIAFTPKGKRVSAFTVRITS